MNICEYEIWDKKKKKMTHCNKEASLIQIPEFAQKNTKGQSVIFLCPEHKEFVVDSLKSDYYVASKKAKNDKKLHRD